MPSYLMILKNKYKLKKVSLQISSGFYVYLVFSINTKRKSKPLVELKNIALVYLVRLGFGFGRIGECFFV